MTDSNVFKLSQPGTFTDLLTEVWRNGAHALLVQAVETEAAAFLETHAGLKTRGRSPTAGAPRPFAGACGDDRDRRGASAPASLARPWSRR